MSKSEASNSELPSGICDDTLAGEVQPKTITQLRASAQTPEAVFALVEGACAPELSFFSNRQHPTDADVGWAAGVLDGEGCVQIARQAYPASSRRQTTYQLRVTIAQTCVGVLREFEWAVGMAGNVSSPKPKLKQNRICHYLIYTGMSAVYVLERLRKHLRRKAQHVELAREFRRRCQIHVHPGGRGTSEEIWKLRRAYWQRMRVLNGR
jgi:hypothetical protein